MLGSQTAGRTPRKKATLSCLESTQEKHLLPDCNFIPLSCHPLGETRSAEKGLPWWLAAGSSGSAFPWPKMLDCWETFCGCVGEAPPSPSPICGEVTWRSSRSFIVDKGGHKGDNCSLWSISLHGCCLSRGTKGLSCSQVRQQVLNAGWGTCYGFALLWLLLILQLFWGFINPVT